MKKFIYGGLFLALVGMVLTSCKKFNPSRPDNFGSSTVKSNSLNTELENFNKSFLLKTQNEVQTKSFWGSLKRFVEIAGADIVGAGAGAESVQLVAGAVGAATEGVGYVVISGGAAVIAGAGASCMAADAIAPSHNDSLYPFKADLKIEYPTKYSFDSSIGQRHNDMVISISNGYNLENLPDDQYKDVYEILLKNKTFMEKVNEINNVTSLFYSKKASFNMDEYLGMVLNKGLITNTEKLVYSDFFKVYLKCNSNSDFEEVLNFYIDAISKSSSLTNNEKQALICSFSVASQSPFFWENQN